MFKICNIVAGFPSTSLTLAKRYSDNHKVFGFLDASKILFQSPEIICGDYKNFNSGINWISKGKIFKKKKKKARFNFYQFKRFFKNMFNNLSKLLPKNYQLQVFVLSFLYFLLSLMEVVGIGSIPIFISAIIDDNYLQSKLNNIDYLNKFEIFKNDNLATIFLFIVLVIFFIKFIYQIFLFNYEAKFLKNVRFYLSSNVFSKFLHEEYKNYYNYNSSEVIRITLSDTERSLSFVRSVFNILKDSFYDYSNYFRLVGC